MSTETSPPPAAVAWSRAQNLLPKLAAALEQLADAGGFDAAGMSPKAKGRARESLIEARDAIDAALRSTRPGRSAGTRA